MSGERGSNTISTRNILVTGATGFIGSHLCKQLVEEGYPVVGLSATGRTRRIKALQRNSGFRLALGDIRDPDFLRTLIKENQVTGVFHLAAKVPNSCDNRDSSGYVDTNVTGTLNLLEAASSAGVERFVYSSSMAVYSVPPKSLPVREDAPVGPFTLYGVCKASGESCCRLFSDKMNVTTLRLGGVYGPSEAKPNVTYRFIYQALRNGPITVYGEGHQSTDFVWVGDVVRVCVAALVRDIPDTYNVGSGEETSILGLARQIVHLTNSKSEIVIDTRETGRPFRFVLDVTKAREKLGLAPASLEVGLRKYMKQLS